MKNFLFITFLLLPSLAFGSICSECHATSEVKINEEVIKTSKKYLHVREKTNHNDNKEIDKWLKNCGLGPGYSYCAAYTVYMFKETFESYGLKSPYPRTAGVARFAEFCVKHPFEFKVISTKKMLWNVDQPEPGDIASFKHGSSLFSGFNYMGHQAITILANKDKTVLLIEGNTKPGPGGDQSGSELGNMKYGQEGVYIRTRTLGLNSKFPIMYFIRLNKRDYVIK